MERVKSRKGLRRCSIGVFTYAKVNIEKFDGRLRARRQRQHTTVSNRRMRLDSIRCREGRSRTHTARLQKSNRTRKRSHFHSIKMCVWIAQQIARWWVLRSFSCDSNGKNAHRQQDSQRTATATFSVDAKGCERRERERVQRRGDDESVHRVHARSWAWKLARTAAHSWLLAFYIYSLYAHCILSFVWFN